MTRLETAKARQEQKIQMIADLESAAIENADQADELEEVLLATSVWVSRRPFPPHKRTPKRHHLSKSFSHAHVHPHTGGNAAAQ